MLFLIRKPGFQSSIVLHRAFATQYGGRLTARVKAACTCKCLGTITKVKARGIVQFLLNKDDFIDAVVYPHAVQRSPCEVDQSTASP